MRIHFREKQHSSVTSAKEAQKGGIGKDVSILTVVKVLTLAVSMISAMLLSRFRTLTEYGTYSQLLLVVQMAASIFMLGLPNSINYFLGRCSDKNERIKFVSTFYVLITVLCGILGVVLCLITPVIVSYFDNHLISTYSYFLLIYPWANAINTSYENVLVCYHKLKTLLVAKSIYGAMLIILICIIVWLDLAFSTYVLFFIVINVFFAIYTYISSLRTAGGFSICMGKQYIRSIFSFSIPLGIATSVSTLNVLLDKMVIGRYFNTEQLAIYSNAAKEMPIYVIATSFTAVLLPRIAAMLKQDNEDKEKALSIWKDSMTISYAIMCFAVTVLFVFAPQVINILYSEKYLDGTEVFRIYSIVLLLRFTYFGMILNAAGKTKQILLCSLASLALNLVLNVLFYYVFGFSGPAIGTLVAMLVVGYLQLYMSAKLLGVKVNRMLPYMQLLKTTAINIVFGAACFALCRLLKIGFSLSDYVTILLIVIVWMVLDWVLLRKSVKKAMKRA